MAKGTYIFITIALTAMVLGACKKDYKCECTISTNDPYMNTTTRSTTTDNFYNSKATARKKCMERQETVDTTEYMHATCKLK